MSTWTTEDGREIDIKSLEGDHLTNILRLLIDIYAKHVTLSIKQDHAPVHKLHRQFRELLREYIYRGYVVDILFDHLEKAMVEQFSKVQCDLG